MSPLQVTTLVSSKSPQKKKGKSKRAHVLVAAVERATANFVERGQLIARENPEIEPEMLQAVDEVRHTGDKMSETARDFATDPCSSAKRGGMVSFGEICFSIHGNFYKVCRAHIKETKPQTQVPGRKVELHC